jgi:transcriptional regulator with XRE-family HTH domain
MRKLETPKTLKPTRDAVEILHRRVYEGSPARLKNPEEARANEEISREIEELRAAAALTQTQLARLIGTTASVICRLEDADYAGQSLAMLRRIAGALNQRVESRFVPVRRSAQRLFRLVREAAIRQTRLKCACPRAKVWWT